jgi:putative two-component system response regulator
MTLPAAKVLVGDPTSRPSSVEPELDGPAASTRILVTEDRSDAPRGVVRTLGDKYVCDFAGDIGEVREKLATGDFELVLCGVTMAGAPGLELAEEIGRDCPDTAVVLMTGEDDPEVAREAFAVGVYGYLVEPFSPGQLLITVMNALRRRELELVAQTLRRNLSEQRQKIIDMAPMPIYVKDASYRYVVANLQADALAGLEEGQLVGLGDEAIMAPEGLERTRAIDREMFERGTAYDAEETLTIGGVERVYKTVKFPLLGGDGEVAAVCGISTDITDQKEALRLRDELTAAQQQAIDELWASHQETVDRFATAIKFHDSSTGDHVNRMASVAALLGTGLHLDAERVRLLRIAAPMHDVGKIAISDRILRKPGPLTTAERSEMQRHTVIGHEILGGSESELLRVAATIALTHHECFDGSGYPHGLAGDDIPIEGRITALADVFDALLSDRCYRPAFAPTEAVAMIEAGRGSQFDPAIVDVLLDNLADAFAARA